MLGQIVTAGYGRVNRASGDQLTGLLEVPGRGQYLAQLARENEVRPETVCRLHRLLTISAPAGQGLGPPVSWPLSQARGVPSHAAGSNPPRRAVSAPRLPCPGCWSCRPAWSRPSALVPC